MRIIQMNDTDTSDAALKTEFDRRYEGYGNTFEAKDITFFAGWEECRRRCEARMEEERRKYFGEGWKKGWSNQFNGWLHTEDEDYRAFKEAQK